MTNTQFCIKHKRIFDGLFALIKNADDREKDVIWIWITNNPDVVRRTAR